MHDAAQSASPNDLLDSYATLTPVSFNHVADIMVTSVLLASGQATVS